MNAQQIIDGLEEIYSQREFLTAKKTELIDSVIPADVKAKIADIEAEFEDKLQAVNTQITEVETMAKELVIQEGATVKGNLIQAVYSKPRVTWDSKILEGLAIVMPEIEKAKKIGSPSVSFRRLGRA